MPKDLHNADLQVRQKTWFIYLFDKFNSGGHFCGKLSKFAAEIKIYILV